MKNSEIQIIFYIFGCWLFYIFYLFFLFKNYVFRLYDVKCGISKGDEIDTSTNKNKFVRICVRE